MTATYDENPCWEGLPDYGEAVPDDYDDDPHDLILPGRCGYCDGVQWEKPSCDGTFTYPAVDPFGGQPVCQTCWEQIVGGE